MIKIDQKNSWAIDLALHIPIPSISIQITNTEKEAIENIPLKHGDGHGPEVDEQS